MILEGTFGWGWMSDELLACRLQPHLASSGKVAGWRKTRGLAKSNKIDADLLSTLWDQKQRWWEVWLAPQQVRDQRELLRHRMALVLTQTGLKNRIHATLLAFGYATRIQLTTLSVAAGWALAVGVAGILDLHRHRRAAWRWSAWATRSRRRGTPGAGSAADSGA